MPLDCRRSTATVVGAKNMEIRLFYTTAIAAAFHGLPRPAVVAVAPTHRGCAPKHPHRRWWLTHLAIFAMASQSPWRLFSQIRRLRGRWRLCGELIVDAVSSITLTARTICSNCPAHVLHHHGSLQVQKVTNSPALLHHSIEQSTHEALRLIKGTVLLSHLDTELRCFLHLINF